MTDKYRVHEIVRFDYSEIGEYIDENHTDRPLRNDEIVGLLNQLSEENEQLKAFIKRLTNNCGEIVLMNGIGYKVDKILGDLND